MADKEWGDNMTTSNECNDKGHHDASETPKTESGKKAKKLETRLKEFWKNEEKVKQSKDNFLAYIASPPSKEKENALDLLVMPLIDSFITALNAGHDIKSIHLAFSKNCIAVRSDVFKASVERSLRKAVATKSKDEKKKAEAALNSMTTRDRMCDDLMPIERSKYLDAVNRAAALEEKCALISDKLATAEAELSSIKEIREAVYRFAYDAQSLPR